MIKAEIFRKKGDVWMQYTTGNLARKIEAQQEPVKLKRVKKSPLLSYKLLGAVLICFTVAMGIQWRDGKIYEMRREIQTQQQTLFRLEAKNKQTQLELDKKLDLKEIEAVASARLNMHKPAKNQMVYLNVNKPDVAEVIKVQQDVGFFASIMQGVGSIVEYLQ